ncbi:RING finger protein 208-like [Nerophis ophidion]|uniref:RING finger protein 208-like n=1 Tax=Nerophis ophidion TaxID=159077 RepID=UPI002AE026A0|nr:RING finger protein 208-like [Nerophis ophidion]
MSASSSSSSVIPEEDDMECVICFQTYCLQQRVPRMLHCNHTFCAPCLERLSHLEGVIRTICCPLCRWITCARASLSLPAALWVNTHIWDMIAHREQQEKKKKEKKEEKKKSTWRKQKDHRLIQPILVESKSPEVKWRFQRMFRCVSQT